MAKDGHLLYNGESVSIAIIDCAINNLSYQCFNRLVQRTQTPMTYHHPPSEGLSSLQNLEDFQGMIIFGSSAYATDELLWKNELSEFAKNKILNKTPTLGICFGLQIVVQAFGGEVDFVDKEKTQYCGQREVEIVEDFIGLSKGTKLCLLKQHHQEVKKLPDDFKRVGTSTECLNDIVAHGALPFWGVQCHPEASSHFVQVEMGEMGKHVQLEEVQRGGDTLIDHFLNIIERA